MGFEPTFCWFLLRKESISQTTYFVNDTTSFHQERILWNKPRASETRAQNITNEPDKASTPSRESVKTKNRIPLLGYTAILTRSNQLLSRVQSLPQNDPPLLHGRFRGRVIPR